MVTVADGTAAMSEVVAYLERHGYVERVADPSDGRAKLVRLTARGGELYGVARRLIVELETKMGRPQRRP